MHPAETCHVRDVVDTFASTEESHDEFDGASNDVHGSDARSIRFSERSLFRASPDGRREASEGFLLCSAEFLNGCRTSFFEGFDVRVHCWLRDIYLPERDDRGDEIVRCAPTLKVLFDFECGRDRWKRGEAFAEAELVPDALEVFGSGHEHVSRGEVATNDVREDFFRICVHALIKGTEEVEGLIGSVLLLLQEHVHEPSDTGQADMSIGEFYDKKVHPIPVDRRGFFAEEVCHGRIDVLDDLFEARDRLLFNVRQKCSGMFRFGVHNVNKAIVQVPNAFDLSDHDERRSFPCYAGRFEPEDADDIFINIAIAVLDVRYAESVLFLRGWVLTHGGMPSCPVKFQEGEIPIDRR